MILPIMGQLWLYWAINIYEDDLSPSIQKFMAQPQGAHVFLKEVDDLHRFGVATVVGDSITEIVEKPGTASSNLAVTGCYLYDVTVFSIIRRLKPSSRGELEITDVNNAYVAAGQMSFTKLTGGWTDAGTFESLLRANLLVARRQGQSPDPADRRLLPSA